MALRLRVPRDLDDLHHRVAICCDYCKERYIMLFPSATSLADSPSAKHLEALKGGKITLEILVRGKDQEENAKQFERCLDLIKGAGVRVILSTGRAIPDMFIEEGWSPAERCCSWTVRGGLEKDVRRSSERFGGVRHIDCSISRGFCDEG